MPPQADPLHVIVDIIIPAFNEEGSIGKVVDEIPKGLVRDILVCDNNSTDTTAAVAKAAGAIIVPAPQKGYGSACLAGHAYIAARPAGELPDIVVYIDGDLSDYPGQLGQVIAPIINGEAELVIGSRALGKRQDGAMLPHQMFGNWLATTLMRLIWGVKFTDLGPFRAVAYPTLMKINMEDPDFGWTVEMQVKAAKLKIRSVEVPVDYRNRAHGKSKVSGSLKNSYLAGQKILWTIFSNI
ncbi:MAG: glycosyltransferase family 2 protein [Saprospiraceae bacterium]